jgi:ketosteroid isomerase-like protein
MSQSREVIQSLYDAFARGDPGFVLGLLADDVHWMEAEGSPMARGNPYTSPQQVGEGVFGRLL